MRKALTPLEASKAMVRKVEQVAPVISSPAEETDRRGRKRTHEATKAAIAGALGVSVSAIVNAEKHVAAVAKYPELNLPGMTQQGAITVAKNLDALPDEARAAQRAAIRRLDMDVLAALSEVPPLPKVSEHPALEAEQRWLKLLHKLSILMGSIEGHGGMAALAAAWPPRARAEVRGELRRIIGMLCAWADALDGEV